MGEVRARGVEGQLASRWGELAAILARRCARLLYRSQLRALDKCFRSARCCFGAFLLAIRALADMAPHYPKFTKWESSGGSMGGACELSYGTPHASWTSCLQSAEIGLREGAVSQPLWRRRDANPAADIQRAPHRPPSSAVGTGKVVTARCRDELCGSLKGRRSATSIVIEAVVLRLEARGSTLDTRHSTPLHSTSLHTPHSTPGCLADAECRTARDLHVRPALTRAGLWKPSAPFLAGRHLAIGPATTRLKRKRSPGPWRSDVKPVWAVWGAMALVWVAWGELLGANLHGPPATCAASILQIREPGATIELSH